MAVDEAYGLPLGIALGGTIVWTVANFILLFA